MRARDALYTMLCAFHSWKMFLCISVSISLKSNKIGQLQIGLKTVLKIGFTLSAWDYGVVCYLHWWSADCCRVSLYTWILDDSVSWECLLVFALVICLDAHTINITPCFRMSHMSLIFYWNNCNRNQMFG